MTWVNPLDKLPQLPVDYANHIVYGGGGGFVFFCAALMMVQAGHPVTHLAPDLLALLLVFIGSAGKKVVDYIKEAESVSMCVTKAFVTCAWPATISAALWLIK